jgi:hypothetical protein
MHKVIVGSMMAVCLAGTGAVVQAAPQWNVGDTWRVGAWHGQVFRPDKRAQTGTYKLKGRMISVAFEVTGVQAVGQTDCYEVKVTFPKEETGFQRRFQVYYDKATGRLLRLKDVSLLPDGNAKDLTTDYSAQTQGPTFVGDVATLVPLDWPDPARQNVMPPASEPATTAQTTTPQSVQSTGGTTLQEDEVTLTKSFANKEVKLVQRWRKGEPWWRTARRYENGNLAGEAVLLEVNGRSVADATGDGQ